MLELCLLGEQYGSRQADSHALPPPPPPGRELRMYVGRGTSDDWEMAFVEHVIFKSDLFGRCVAAD